MGHAPSQTLRFVDERLEALSQRSRSDEDCTALLYFAEVWLRRQLDHR